MPTPFIGRKIEIGIGSEAIRGTAVAPSYWLSSINADIDDKFDQVTDEESMGIIEDANDLKISKKYAEGTIGGYLSDISFGLILKATLGTDTKTTHAGETTVYDHTFSLLESCQHPTLTLEAKNPAQQLKFANAVVQSLDIKAELGKFVEFTTKVMAQTGVTSANTPSYPTEHNFMAKDVTVKFATTQAGLDAASAINVKNVEITFEKNIESDDIFRNPDAERFP